MAIPQQLEQEISEFKKLQQDLQESAVNHQKFQSQLNENEQIMKV